MAYVVYREDEFFVSQCLNVDVSSFGKTREEAVANPAAFGFTNVTDSCLIGGPFIGGIPCATPEAHLFWDAIHPTTAAHAILADNAFMITAPMTVLPGNANLQ